MRRDLAATAPATPAPAIAVSPVGAPAAAAIAEPAAPVVAAVVAAAIAAAVAAAAPAAAAPVGDPARGEKVYERCEGCHSIDRDRIGPRHKGVVGRKAGSIGSFAYSTAMKNSGLTWDEATLDKFLQGPTKLVPGTRMGFAGVPDEKDRADLIAFLKKAGE